MQLGQQSATDRAATLDAGFPVGHVLDELIQQGLRARNDPRTVGCILESFPDR